MGRLEIVAPGAAHGGRLDTKSLWIAPDLWKTPRTRFPQGLWTRRERAPTRSTGVHIWDDERQTQRPRRGVSLHSRRCFLIISALA